jgi:hypothetical protein
MLVHTDSALRAIYAAAGVLRVVENEQRGGPSSAFVGAQRVERG